MPSNTEVQLSVLEKEGLKKMKTQPWHAHEHHHCVLHLGDEDDIMAPEDGRTACEQGTIGEILTIYKTPNKSQRIGPNLTPKKQLVNGYEDPKSQCNKGRNK